MGDLATVQQMLLPIAVLLGALTLTVAVECLLAFSLGQRRLLGLILYVNLLTNPLLNLLLFLGIRALGNAAYLPLLLGLEVLAVLVEAGILHRVGGLKAAGGLRLSVMLNAGSFSLGWLIQHMLGPFTLI